jgi:fluoroacetyl-CoA thioesterase
MRPGLFEGFTHIETLAPEPCRHSSGSLADYTGYPDAPPVFAAAFFAGLVEWTCMRALGPFLDADERCLGARLDLANRCRGPAGGRITTIVEVVAVNGGQVTFRARCQDDGGVIAEGRHTRHVRAAAQTPRRPASKLVAAC